MCSVRSVHVVYEIQNCIFMNCKFKLRHLLFSCITMIIIECDQV